MIDDIFVSQIKAQGVNPLENEPLAEYFLDQISDNPVSVEFMTESGNLALIFLYQPIDQPEGFRRYDGMVFRHEHNVTGQIRFSIGIATSAIMRGKSYLNALWLHECAHVLHGTNCEIHDTRFHAVFHALIDSYNSATGSALNAI